MSLRCSEGEAIFTGLGGGADTSNTILLPWNVTVSDARVTMKGSDDGSGNYPTAPSLDVYTKDNQKVYEFATMGAGAWGKQTTFSTNTDETKLEFRRATHNTETQLILPKGAQISDAKMSMSAEEWDSLLGVSELTSANDSHYEWDLSMEVLNGKAYVRPPGGPALPTNNPSYIFLAVPSSTQGPGVVDVLSADSGFTRHDTDPYLDGIQSIPVPGATFLSSYYRQ